jgi:hypothetical protein
MILIMILSGLLSSMYVWSDQLDDIRLSVNDFYMIGLMTGFMIFFMSLLGGDRIYALMSLGFVALMFFGIRAQAFVSKNQYFTGMIPHHSMAVLMSRRLLEKDGLTEEERTFVQNIIDTQKKEIAWMKSRL